jgi:hypothetical protein
MQVKAAGRRLRSLVLRLTFVLASVWSLTCAGICDSISSSIKCTIGSPLLPFHSPPAKSPNTVWRYRREIAGESHRPITSRLCISIRNVEGRNPARHYTALGTLIGMHHEYAARRLLYMFSHL